MLKTKAIEFNSKTYGPKQWESLKRALLKHPRIVGIGTYRDGPNQYEVSLRMLDEGGEVSTVYGEGATPFDAMVEPFAYFKKHYLKKGKPK